MKVGDRVWVRLDPGGVPEGTPTAIGRGTVHLVRAPDAAWVYLVRLDTGRMIDAAEGEVELESVVDRLAALGDTP